MWMVTKSMASMAPLFMKSWPMSAAHACGFSPVVLLLPA
jgi:hypothetical protein